jgi:hypothetical protein
LLRPRTIQLIVILLAFVSCCRCQQVNKRIFTVADETALLLFESAAGGGSEIHRSPDGKYFAVWFERGDLNLNAVQDSLRFYRTEDIDSLLAKTQLSPPVPLWELSRSDKNAGSIGSWRWLPNSTAVIFLERTTRGNQRLVMADLRSKMSIHLTSEEETVEAFDVHDASHYVYTSKSAPTVASISYINDKQPAAIVGTDRSISDVLFPRGMRTSNDLVSRISLWAVIGSNRLKVQGNKPELIPFVGDLSLSPDGFSVITTVPVPDVPKSWSTKYSPPAGASDLFRISPGQFNPRSGESHAHQFVTIDLRTGITDPITNAPLASEAGWAGYGRPSWSKDGGAILLPETYLDSDSAIPSRPCVAVIDLRSKQGSCVFRLKGYTERNSPDYSRVDGADFVNGDRHRVSITSTAFQKQPAATEYEQLGADVWRATKLKKDSTRREIDDITVEIKEGFDNPPVVKAANPQTSRTLWKPNPRLQNLDIGQAAIYTWRDEQGNEQKAGLFKPSDYQAGRRYPLLIQTHGFDESQFRPSGGFTTAFAARELASAGIVVLQVGQTGTCPDDTPEEGPCISASYRHVVQRLVSEGIVDPERIGIIGFSATCFHVMTALINGSVHAKAASVTDGIMVTYMQYLFFGFAAPEFDLIIGAKPFDEGLNLWFKRSVGFHFDKISAPLLVVGESPQSLLAMWEPYAVLHYLHKPVDLIMLNTDEHVLTNPAVRMASQGGSVDWFRFWLQGYEDPDPSKADQYMRWRGLKTMQNDNMAKQQNASSIEVH